MDPIPHAHGEWLPDVPRLGSPGAPVVFNLAPLVSRGYGVIQRFTPSSQSLGSRCLGAYAATDVDGEVNVYAATANALWELGSLGVWDDRSRLVGGAYDADRYWDTTEWVDNIIFAQLRDYPQWIAKGGTNFADVIQTWKSDTVALVHGQFLMHGNIVDDVEGNQPYRLIWSAANDMFDYTPDPLTQAGQQDLKSSGGGIVKVVGGTVGKIFLSREIWLAQYVGGDIIFDIQPTETGTGLAAKLSVVQLQENDVYFLSWDGFRRFQHTRSIQLDEGKVHEHLQSVMDPTRIGEVVGMHTLDGHAVFWLVPGRTDPAGSMSHLFVYNYVVDRWGYANVPAEFAFAGATRTSSPDDFPGESPDNASGSPDDSQWTARTELLALFTPTGELAYPESGTSYEAYIEGPEKQIFAGRRAMVSGVRPIVEEATDISIAIGYRNRQQDALQYTGAVAPQSTGLAAVRKNARYHTVRTVIAADQPQARALGYEVEATPTGRR